MRYGAPLYRSFFAPHRVDSREEYRISPRLFLTNLSDGVHELVLALEYLFHHLSEPVGAQALQTVKLPAPLTVITVVV